MNDTPQKLTPAQAVAFAAHTLLRKWAKLDPENADKIRALMAGVREISGLKDGG